jgi:hypothetical protein
LARIVNTYQDLSWIQNFPAVLCWFLRLQVQVLVSNYKLMDLELGCGRFLQMKGVGLRAKCRTPLLANQCEQLFLRAFLLPLRASESLRSGGVNKTTAKTAVAMSASAKVFVVECLEVAMEAMKVYPRPMGKGLK